MIAVAEPGFQIAHDPDTVPLPDVAFVRADRIPPGGVKRFFQGPPDIAVEVVSPTDRASEVMAKGAGLVTGRLSVGLGGRSGDPHDLHYRSRSEIGVLSDTDTLTGGDVLPGFSVPVREVFG